MAEKKSSLLAVLQILQEETDAEHILTRNEILERIEQERGLRMDRRTLYSNISVLREYGYDISTFDENGKGYALLQRDFTPAEITWLCNAVHASNFIPRKDSEEMIRKLLRTQNEHVRKAYSNSVYLPNRRKTENCELFRNIEKITEAITEKKQISFSYMTYSPAKKLVAKRKAPYEVEPRYIVYSDGKGYLIATSSRHEGFTHYRIDRMKCVAVKDYSSSRLLKTQDPYEYARNKLFMFSGENLGAQLKCKISVLNQMLDVFGPETSIMMIDEDFFTIHVTAPEQGLVWLAQQYIDAVEVISPASVRDAVRKNLEEALKVYRR